MLVTGANFGCGSSREHAPWALRDYGFRAVVSTSIADIFFSNALKNGLVPVRVDAGAHAWLLANPGAEVEVDVAAGELRLPGGRAAPFQIDPFARHCLLNGVDELGYLLSRLPDIEAWDRQRGQTPLEGTVTFKGVCPLLFLWPLSVWGETPNRFRLSHKGWETRFGMSKG